MSVISWTKNGSRGIAARRGSELINPEGLDLMSILAGPQGIERAVAATLIGPVLDPAGFEYLPPLSEASQHHLRGYELSGSRRRK